MSDSREERLTSIALEMHEKLGEYLLKKLKDESITGAELTVARQWLRDNEICGIDMGGAPVENELLDILPFSDPESGQYKEAN